MKSKGGAKSEDWEYCVEFKGVYAAVRSFRIGLPVWIFLQKELIGVGDFLHPVGNDTPLLCPVHHAVQGSAAGLDTMLGFSNS